MQRLARLIAPRFHYSWLALAVVFLILLLVSAFSGALRGRGGEPTL